VTIVILAAGSARRMGRQKLLLPLGDRTMLEHVIAAAAGRPALVVAGPDVARRLPTGTRVVVNDAPQRGMAHSLRLADAALPPDEPIAIVLGDQPGITAAAIAAVVDRYASDVDVVSAHGAHGPAHPVIFGPVARRRIRTLPDGDTLRALRDAGDLRCLRIELPASLAADDIDTPEEYESYRNSKGY
jgi:molybdenum cofactor cytidylyltransferase